MRVRWIVLTIVVLAVLVGGAVLADGIFRERTEDRLAAELQADFGGLDAPPDVTIDGFPFLTQVLAGQLEQVHVTAPEAVVEGLALQEVDVRLRGVSTDQPTTAQEARLEAFLRLAEIQELVPVSADLVAEEGRLVARTTLLGLPVEAVLRPRPAGRQIEVGIEELRLGGAVVSVDDLPSRLTDQLAGLTVPIEQLPDGLELTDLVVEEDGVRLTAEGSDVVLDSVGGS